ncbi:MAG: hypothetical protein DBX91_09015 [Subdoligranulum variabile]|nr:MAG: hypothetical protein DBX91_09015 [Subdoligranulum variabile]
MKTKRTLTSAVAMLTALSMLAGCGSAAASSTADESTAGAASEAATGETGANGEFEPMTIAYAANATDETFAQLKDALDNVIGPALNIEFTYSEPINDTGALTTFIENSYAAGADAVITNLSSSIDQAAAVCNDLGLYFVGISSTGAVENTDMPYYVASTGASAEGYGEAYANVINSIISDGEEHGILILSGAAAYGATSFIEGTAGSLRALQDVYGLTYTQDIDTLATSATQVDAENDKGIKITVFPGMEDLATNVSPLLQTGEYDVVVGTTNIYDSLGVAINEVEEALDMDIEFITRGVFSDAMDAAFNGTDSQGNQIVDGLVIGGTFENVSAVILLRNAFDGNTNMRDGDNCARVTGWAPLAVTSVEDYNILSGDDMPYAFVSTEDLLSLCGPDVTWQDVADYGMSLTTENIVAKYTA